MKARILLCPILIPTFLAGQPKEELRAVWLTNVDSNVLFSDKSIAEAMDYLASIGINLVFPVVWNKGHTLYPSDVMNQLFGVPIIPDFAGRDPLQRVVIEAHRNGMEVIPWFEFGFSSSYSLSGGHLIGRFPRWASKMRAYNGASGTYDTVLTVKNGFDWMAGTNPEVQDFLISLVTEVIDRYDVDGVQGDDRLPAMPIEGGYDAATIALYRAEHSGLDPPSDVMNPEWARWRADKLNQFFKRLRDSVKTRGSYLILSSTPSPYPWGYDNYLQDSKTWMDEGIVDHLIPQLYRYNYNDYVYELNKALGYVPLNKRSIFFAGILARVGSYYIRPGLLDSCIRANRYRNVNGESFFFYEGLRAEGNRRGDTLKATFYSQPALLPYRNRTIWRPKATIVNEDDLGVTRTGSWRQLNFPGFKPNFYMAADTGYSSIAYTFDVPYSGWYDIFVYNIPNYINTSRAPYTVFVTGDSITTRVDQTDVKSAGWHKLQTAYLTHGLHAVIRLDNSNIGEGRNVIADAAMIMINRKLSPDLVISSVGKKKHDQVIPEAYRLHQNYPNPFNPSTTISFQLPTEGLVTLRVFDVIGREVATLLHEAIRPGDHSVVFDAGTSGPLPSGVYFYRLTAGDFTISRAMMVLK